MIRLHIAIPLFLTAAFLGWTIGGFHAQRAAALEWTGASVVHATKAGRGAQ